MSALLRTSPKGIYGLSKYGPKKHNAKSNQFRWDKIETITHNAALKSYLNQHQTEAAAVLSSAFPIVNKSNYNQNRPHTGLIVGAPSLLSLPSYTINTNSLSAVRYFSMTSSRWEQSSSKVEESIKKIQEKEKEKIVEKTASAAISTSAGSDVTKAVIKKSLKTKIWEELVHYYHGFRLLFIDINVARKLLGKVLNGKTLTRREYMLLIRTTGDVFRLVPFSVFIIVPFMEFLLPVFIKFFPGMLPSTFETAKDMEDKARKNLKVKLEMAKFLQKTLDEMDVQHKDHKSEEAKNFIEFFHKLRTSGERATPEEIMKFSKLFEDEITLDSLSRQQLTAICKVLEVSTIGTNNFLRFQLRMKLRTLAADDRMIQKEGVETLTLGELQAASRARGMRSYGLSETQLQHQILEWINLSLNEKVPPSLLLLSRAMMLPEDVPTTDKLKASISVLSDSAAIQTKAAIGEREGKIDNKTKIDIIRDEQRKIKEELEELKEVEKVEVKEADVLLDPAPIINVEAQQQLSTKDIEVMSEALEAVSDEKKSLLLEKEEIKDLKEEIADYKEDVEELQQISKQADKKDHVRESAASKLLLKKVDSMISKIDKVMDDLEKKEAQLEEKEHAAATDDLKKSETVTIDEIITAIRKMQKIPDEAKVEQIFMMLGKIDTDKDGQLQVDDVLKLIETIGKENVNLTPKHVDELIDLISKEEHLENEDKIEKALAKSKILRESAKLSADKAKVLTDDEVQTDQQKSPEVTAVKATTAKAPSKIDERINITVIQNATEAAERQKDKILPPSLPGTEVPKTPQLPTGGATNPKDKTL